MPNTADLVKEVYIDPIKSVLFIDDQFPTYEDLFTAPTRTPPHSPEEEADLEGIEEEEALALSMANKFANKSEIEHNQPQPLTTATAEAKHRAPNTEDDPERSLKLSRSCRSKGFIFDIENNPQKILNNEHHIDFINKPDLIVLDYFLDGSDGHQALNIIKRLNSTPRTNLVVVYTTQAPTDVALEIAYSLTSLPHFEKRKGFDKRTSNISNELLRSLSLNFLNDYTHARYDLKKWKNSLSNSKIEGHDLVPLFSEFLKKEFETTQTPDDITHLGGCGIDSQNTPWVSAQNVFIAVVKKPAGNDESIDTLLAALHNALAHYNPAPSTLIINQSINILRRDIEATLNDSFGDKDTRAALLYHTLKGKFHGQTNDIESKARFSDYLNKAFMSITNVLHDKMGDFSQKALPTHSAQASDLLSISRDKEKASISFDKKKAALLLNAFLCSEPIKSNHLTNGTIFQDTLDPTAVWLCTTPACDMVPNRHGNNATSYKHELKPFSYFEAIRLTQASGDAISTACANATHCKHIFIKTTTHDEILVFNFYNNEDTPFTHIFYSETNFRLNENHQIELIKPTTKSCFKCSNPHFYLQAINCRVIGQLRSDYANRFLSIKGAWQSRIGVDFVTP